MLWLDRARTFYEAVFDLKHTEVLVQGDRQIVVVDGQPNVSINQTDGFVPPPTAPGTQFAQSLPVRPRAAAAQRPVHGSCQALGPLKPSPLYSAPELGCRPA